MYDLPENEQSADCMFIIFSFSNNLIFLTCYFIPVVNTIEVQSVE